MGFLRDDQGRLIRRDGSLVPPVTRHRGPRRTVIDGEGGAVSADGKPARVSHMRVDMILGGAGPLRDEYERMLENPATLLKDLQAWFAARGHHVNKSAIGRHRKHYLAQWNDIRTAAKTSAAFADIVHRDGRGGGAFIESAQAKFEMGLMERLTELKREKNITPEQWLIFCKTLSGTVWSRKCVNAMRVEFEERAKRAAKECEDAARKGVSGKDIAARVREILGA